MKRFKRGFTLAEVLITLAIIGVVAAISIPSVISNTQQQEFKTGLRKAVSVLNSAITMNMATDGESPYDNANLYGYLMRHMAVMKSTTRVPWSSRIYHSGSSITGEVSNAKNAAFYTTDGMRFEFVSDEAYGQRSGARLHERVYGSTIYACDSSQLGFMNDYVIDAGATGKPCGGCGSYGLYNNPNSTTKPPCAILVDVNGDRKPTPGNVNCTSPSCTNSNIYKVPPPGEKLLRDTFLILITDRSAIPFGVTAQKAMYDAQVKK